MKRSLTPALVATIAGFFVCGAADAHVSIISGPGFAARTQEITFGVGHGCDGADTLSVRVDLPPEVVSVRALTSDFGPVTYERNTADVVTSVTWEKPQESVLDADTNYYKLTLRLGVPNQPFTTLYFAAVQTCQASDGTLTEVEWISTDPTAMDVEPAAALVILPPRVPGWNQFTVPEAVEDLSVLFGDALIVWSGDAAYSANPTTAELIDGTPDVTALTTLDAGDEIWVKY